MSDQNLMRALRVVDEAEIQQAPKQHRLQTPQCPSLPRFAVAVWKDWTAEEKTHVSGCPYCQKIIAMERRLGHEPPPELVSILLPAYGRGPNSQGCLGFQGTCKSCMRWDPAGGHVPRGFRGAIGRVEEVKLVLVCAEPGDPYPGEGCEPPSGAPLDYLRMVYNASYRHLEQRVDQFAKNIRDILDAAWPGLPFEEQMRKTWITESVLCSAAKEGASVPRTIEKECQDRYLLKQLALFPNARIVALGRKAQKRLARARVRFVPAWAASPPGCNCPEARESWKQAVAGL